MAALKFYYKGTIAMSTSCVRIYDWPELERAMDLPSVMMLTPNMIACNGRMMRDLLKCYLISPEPSLIGLTENWIKGLCHLNSKLSDTESISYNKLKALQDLF